MQRLWEVMTEAYGHRWISGFGEEPNRTWTRKLAVLADQEIARAIEKCTSSADDWPPSVGSFLELARGSYQDHGMPDPGDAYAMAVNRDFSQRGVFHAVARAGGHYDWSRMPADRGKRAFEKGYQEALEAARAGQPIKQAPSPAPNGTPQVEHQGGHSEESARLAKEQMAKIRQTLSMGGQDE